MSAYPAQERLPTTSFRNDADLTRWQQVSELVRTLKVLGLSHTRKLLRARQVGAIQLVRGHFTTRVLASLFQVGFFDDLVSRGRIDLPSYAREKGYSADVLQALCAYLYAQRILDRDARGAYVLDKKGAFFVEMLHGLFESTTAYEDVLYHLPDLIRGTKVYGREVHRDDAHMASASGAGGALFGFPLVVDTMVRAGLRCPVDLACGDARFLIHLCKALPDARAYGVDLSAEAVATARARVEQQNLQDRIQLVHADMFDIARFADQLRGVDSVTCFYGFQELLSAGRERLLELLAAYRRALPGVTFIVMEIPRYSAEELRAEPRGILEHHLYHALTNQKLQNRQEWNQLWKEAGFRDIQERYLPFARTVIYTLR